MSPPPAGTPRWVTKDKPHDLKKTMSRVIDYIGSLRWTIYFGISLSIFSTLLAIIGPQYLEQIANSIYYGIGGTIDIQSVVTACLILTAIYLGSLVLNISEHYIIQRTSMVIGFMLRKDATSKLDRVPLKFFDRYRTGDLMSRVTNDTDTISENFGPSVSMLLTSITTIVGAFLMMIYTCAELALYATIPVIISFTIMQLITRRSQKYFVRQAVDLGGINGIVEETYYAMDIVRAYNGSGKSAERFDAVNSDLLRSGFMARFLSGLMPRMMSFFNNLGYVVVCVIGCLMISSGKISFGVVVAFIVYVRQFTQPISQIADAISSIQSVGASGERLFEILDAPEMEPAGAEAKHIVGCSGHVEFRDVCFSYTPGSEVIRNFSLDIPAGSKVAIVGPTGAGKTTIANLLMRFYDTDSGSILIDGVPTSEVPRHEVHDLFAMVLQDAWIFRGTVRDNIVFTKNDASDEEVWSALDSVGISDYVRDIGGLDTMIGGADTLSAGQKQQISIARALIRNSPMIILDEATSSVDTRTEKLIQKAMDDLTAGRTSFIIAHRLTTIREADMILVLRNGQIVEIGTHASLLELDGFYADLYRSQFRNCE